MKTDLFHVLHFLLYILLYNTYNTIHSQVQIIQQLQPFTLPKQTHCRTAIQKEIRILFSAQ